MNFEKLTETNLKRFIKWCDSRHFIFPVTYSKIENSQGYKIYTSLVERAEVASDLAGRRAGYYCRAASILEAYPVNPWNSEEVARAQALGNLAYRVEIEAHKEKFNQFLEKQNGRISQPKER